MAKYFKKLPVTIKEVNAEQAIIRAVFSTNDVDRAGEVVDQASWILDNYIKDPVVLFGHNHDIPAIGKVLTIGYNEQGNLEGDIQFAVEEHELANTIFKLYKGGYMRAFSVGFMSGKVDVVDDQVILRDNELFEISAVNVPANAQALAKAKSNGIDVTALEKALPQQIVPVEKEGRVLSKSNRAKVENAVAALQAVLDADKKEDKSVNNGVKGRKTPVAKGDNIVTTVKINQVNKAVRSLLKERAVK